MNNDLTCSLSLSLSQFQLDFIIIFILDKVGEYPECSILRNCGVLMVIAFIPLFPITLLRDLTPLQFTSTTRWAREWNVYKDVHGEDDQPSFVNTTAKVTIGNYLLY